ncbi:hypothetical protein EVAR_17964_1 [Eumeta japonica]|uniref:Uncharacterized protein n=1 Tax=Eumeta variegata TaxID=151549 RepID=A0A4C1UYA1_EUMVA|nr:hypothetical protein EVAR_17964_1 [Eumeta japonica]
MRSDPFEGGPNLKFSFSRRSIYLESYTLHSTNVGSLSDINTLYSVIISLENSNVYRGRGSARGPAFGQRADRRRRGTKTPVGSRKTLYEFSVVFIDIESSFERIVGDLASTPNVNRSRRASRRPTADAQSYVDLA